MRFGRWLESEFIRRGMDRAEFTSLVKVAHPTVGRWLDGSDAPSSPNIAKIARILMVDPDDIYQRIHDGTLQHAAPRSFEDIMDEVQANKPLAVPVIQNLIAHMGTGGGVIEDYVYLPATFRRGKAKSICAITATGECMEPMISPGNIVVFDKNASWSVGNIVVAIVNGEVLVKRLVEVGGKQVLRGDADGSIVRLDETGKDEGIVGRVIQITRSLFD